MSLRRYHYRALDAHALPRHGWLEATSPDDLRRLLAEASLTLLFAWRLPGPGRRLPPAELTRLCFELGQLLDAGLPLLTALTLCQREAEDPTLAACLQRLGYDLRQGQTLSQAMSQQPRHFDGDLIATIRASEQSGDLAQAFLTLHQHRAWLAAFRQELWQALLPPLLGAFATLAASIFLWLHTAPALAQFAAAQGLRLPDATQWLLARMSGQHPWLSSLALLTLLMAGVLWAARHHARSRRWLHARLLKLPLIGPIWRESELARFCRTLALLYQAGLPLSEAVPCSAGLFRNAALQAAVQATMHSLAGGQTLSAAFAACPHFPPRLAHLTAIGEQSGRLDLTLHNLSEQLMQRARARLQHCRALLPSLITLGFGSLLLLSLWAVISPVYDLISTAGYGR